MIDGLPDASSVISGCDSAITHVDNLVSVLKLFYNATITGHRPHSLLCVFVLF